MNHLAEKLWRYFEAASRFDWAGWIERFDAGVTRQIEASRTLASKGWTIPGWIYLSELPELSQMKDSDIDDYFTAAYSGNNFERLHTLSASLVSDNGFETWREFLEQIKECILAGKYQVTIPALLSIFEGYVIRTIVKPTGRDARNVRLLEHLKKRVVSDNGLIASIPAAPWASASTFLDNLFKNSPFDEPAPSFIGFCTAGAQLIGS